MQTRKFSAVKASGIYEQRREEFCRKDRERIYQLQVISGIMHIINNTVCDWGKICLQKTFPIRFCF